jgi:uncharacterized Zn finger protein (UPF0148 family)
MEKRLGQYMLQGWALLGETCPSGCPCPLVFKKSSNIYKCVQCDEEFPTAHEQPKPKQLKAPIVAASNWTSAVSQSVEKKLMEQLTNIGEVQDQELLRKMLENVKTMIEVIKGVQ